MQLHLLAGLCLAAPVLAPLATAQSPTVDAVSPTDASTPTTVLVTGTGLSGASVQVDGQPVTVVTNDATSLTFVPPASDPGAADLTVTTPGGQITVADGLTLWPRLEATTTGVGGTVELTLSTGDAGFRSLALGFGELPAPLPIGAGIDFGLLIDPGLPFLILLEELVPTTAPVVRSLPVPPSSALIGVQLFFQDWAQQGLLPPIESSFSNLAVVSLDTVAIPPPANLTYAVNPAVYDLGVPIAPNAPSVDGLVEQFGVVVQPQFGFGPLPAGLSLDPNTGVLSGTPTEVAVSDQYLIAASNAAGGTTAVLDLAVVGPLPPANLSYGTLDATYEVGARIEPNLPSFNGVVTSWTILPRLPSGLFFDAQTGVISGTPLQTQGATSHTVTASNASGSDSVTLQIAVVDPPPPLMQLVEVTSGFGALLPHRVLELVDGVPSTNAISIRSVEDVLENVIPGNPVLPTPSYPTGAVLPNGAGGNHYMAIRYTQPIDLASVIGPQPGAFGTSLVGTVVLVGADPATGAVVQVQAQALVGGFGYLPGPSGGTSSLVQHVALDPSGQGVTALTPEGLGFPGTQGGFAGDQVLVDPSTLVLVADSDGDLSTHETFPAGLQLRLRFDEGVRSDQGAAAVDAGLASSTVGSDQLPPEVGLAVQQVPLIDPPLGSIDVDPETPIRIEWTEPVQPTSVGRLDNGQSAGTSQAVVITFGPAPSQTTVPFTVRPVGPYDLTTYDLIPAFAFPGSGPVQASCGEFSRVDLFTLPFQVRDLASNLNQQQVSSFFEVGPGPALINAPVAPDALYVLRDGGQPSISVIDLNGFGAGTGNPAYDPQNPIQKGNSNYPNNPNVAFQGNLVVPPLAPGNCTFNGGSAGVFTLTLDSNLSDRLLTPSQIDSAADMALGAPLDLVFNNSTPPFGCQAGSPNVCASTGLKGLGATPFGPSVVPNISGPITPFPTNTGNLIAWAPHPNPPPLVFPPPCTSPMIGGQEPTSFDTQVPNLLAPAGDPLGNPQLGIPPTGLLALTQNAFFVGPSLPQPLIANCASFAIRQQVGHFGYVADELGDSVTVINSNRFTILDSVDVQRPSSLAISPGIRLMAVGSAETGVLSLVDVDPSSTNFHQVVKELTLAPGIADVVWQPDGEELLVVNELTDELLLISAFTLEVQKVIDTTVAGVEEPFRLAVTNRHTTFGTQRNVWFAYVIGGNGALGLFESGPEGVNGFGPDTLLAIPGLTFDAPKDLRLDPVLPTLGAWIAHESPLDPATGQPSGQTGGAVTRVQFLPQAIGQLPPGGSTPLTVADRQLDVDVISSIGEDVLTGIPVSIAFEELTNLGGILRPEQTPFAPAAPPDRNSKSPATVTGAPGRSPRFMFVTVPNSTGGTSAVDVVELFAEQRLDVDVFAPGVQSIVVDGATQVVSWFRQ